MQRLRPRTGDGDDRAHRAQIVRNTPQLVDIYQLRPARPERHATPRTAAELATTTPAGPAAVQEESTTACGGARHHAEKGHAAPTRQLARRLISDRSFTHRPRTTPTRRPPAPGSPTSTNAPGLRA